MFINNAFTGTYQPQTKGLTERFKRSIIEVISCSVSPYVIPVSKEGLGRVSASIYLRLQHLCEFTIKLRAFRPETTNPSHRHIS